MLINLHVRNFALIEEADVDFAEGLNILTGETGAGKSLLIDAVNACLGGRIHSGCLRSGCEFAYVEMVFSLDPEKAEALQAMDISTEYDCIVISRKIYPSRSVHKINDETVTSARVRQVTSLLIDIHGQHEHQSLMKKEKHLEVLDQFGGEEMVRLRQAMSAAYTRFQKSKKELDRWGMDEESRRRELDFLQYEAEEIRNARLKESEKEELEVSFKRLSHAQRIQEALGEAYMLLAEGDSASEKISRAARELSSVTKYDTSLEELSGELMQIDDLMSSVTRELSDARDALAADPQELSRIGDRLDEIHHIESKYGGSFEEVMKALVSREARIEELTSFSEKQQLAEAEYKLARTELQQTADELSDARRAAIPPLRERLTEAIQELNFSHVDFDIRMEKLAEPASYGQDMTEFYISLNAGQEPQPLGRVASGGELSRIMLAIKAVLADKDEIPTLIFDEVDAGISGRTAQKVSEKLALIGRHRQVICITHLPQIAGMADAHYRIRKQETGGRTQTEIRRLAEEECVEELARLLGGARVTDTVYRNAREIKALAEETKKNL